MGAVVRDQAEPIELGFVEFTIDLKGRSADRTPLTHEEADAMWRLGFRFSIFEPGHGEFAISLPYTTIWDMTRDRLRFRQQV